MVIGALGVENFYLALQGFGVGQLHYCALMIFGGKEGEGGTIRGGNLLVFLTTF